MRTPNARTTPSGAIPSARQTIRTKANYRAALIGDFFNGIGQDAKSGSLRALSASPLTPEVGKRFSH